MGWMSCVMWKYIYKEVSLNAFVSQHGDFYCFKDVTMENSPWCFTFQSWDFHGCAGLVVDLLGCYAV